MVGVLMGEKPQYELSQVKKRVLVPKLILLILLGFVFYVGILLNVVLLDLSAQEETTVQLMSLALIGLLILVGLGLSIVRSHQKYQFFRDRVVFGSRVFYYKDITEPVLVRGLLDTLFKTKKIVLAKGFIISNVDEGVGLEKYLNDLAAYAKRS